jgi:hypothetical protein
MEQMEQRMPSEATPADGQDATSENGLTGRQIAVIALVVILVLVAVSALTYGLIAHPVLTSVLRDISIIVLALVTLITCIFLAILLVQLQSLIVLLREEIQPILESVNDTAGTVRGTTTFVSDAVVSPMIKVASYAAGIRTTVKTLVGSPSRRSAPEPEPGPNSELD